MSVTTKIPFKFMQVRGTETEGFMLMTLGYGISFISTVTSLVTSLFKSVSVKYCLLQDEQVSKLYSGGFTVKSNVLDRFNSI